MTHILPFRKLFGSVFTLQLSNSRFSHEAVSNSGNPEKENCQTLARQGYCLYKSICHKGREQKLPHASLILHKTHVQCSSDANVPVSPGRTNNRFVGSEGLFHRLFHF